MNTELKNHFLELWKKYFGKAELPIIFYYTDGDGGAEWAERPRAVIGMFDPSARPCVPEDVLTFAVPIKKFEKMIGYMEETFLITETWKTVRKRINMK
jgi:hypothetical protein